MVLRQALQYLEWSGGELEDIKKALRDREERFMHVFLHAQSAEIEENARREVAIIQSIMLELGL